MRVSADIRHMAAKNMVNNQNGDNTVLYCNYSRFGHIRANGTQQSQKNCEERVAGCSY